jgi:hypothetical protein
MLLIILVVGVVGFFLYDYLIGSLVEVTIEARDTEKKLAGTMDGKLFEGEGTSAIKSFSGSTTLSLRPGDYRVEWDTGSSEYEDPGTSSFRVSSESKDGRQIETTVFEKDIPVQLINFSFPSTLVVGQTAATATLTLENSSAQTQTIELVYDGDLDEKILDIATQPSTIIINPNATLPVTLSISVPTSTFVKNTKNGDSKKGTVRIKYTNESKGASYTLFKSLALDINPKTPQTFAVTANKLYTKTFTIRNNSGVDIPESVKADVQVKSAQENDIPNTQKWFSWNPSSPFTTPKKSESIPIVLNILAPSNVLSDTITGEIKLYTGFWSQIVPFTLNLTEALVELKVTLDTTSGLKKYALQKDLVTGQYESKNALLKLENMGGLPIDNILMDVSTCPEYIKQLDSGFFLDLKLPEKGKTGSSATTTLQITAPPSALPGGEQNCLLQISYLNPKNGDAVQMDPITVQIET